MLKNIKSRYVAVVAVPLATFAASAHAELPAGVETAITTAGSDFVNAVGMVMGAMVAGWGLMKVGRKFGWI